MVVTRLKQNWRRLSLLQQLLLSLWLCSVPMNVFGSYVVWRHVYNRVRTSTLVDIAQDLGMINQVVNDWIGDNRDYLQFLAASASVGPLDARGSNQILTRSSRVNPNFNLAIFSPAGLLLASNEAMPPSMAPADIQRRLRADWFQQALRGQGSLGLWRRAGSGLICISQAMPIVRGHQVLGVLQSCTPITEVAGRSGVTTMLRVSAGGAASKPWMDPANGRFQGWGYLLVAGDGEAVLLHRAGSVTQGGSFASAQAQHLLASRQIHNLGWQRLLRTIQTMPLLGGDPTPYSLPDYYLVVADVQQRFRLAAVVDYETSLGKLRQLTMAVVAANLLALLVSSFAIARICRHLLRPIGQVGDAMQQFSEGQFAIHLAGGPNTEMDALFDHINSSAQRLGAYVEEAKRNAVTTAQVAEAKRMQADFLIDPLPQRPGLHLAALCQPAYEIGADWYDVVALGEATAVVVADVCDKGIPSALYMSVFRSLLRLSLIEAWKLGADAGSTVQAALSNVNRYMASTHASSGMFATAFVGLFEPGSKRLTYALAGHETPFLMRDLEAPAPELQISGPALGLFAEAPYAIHACTLQEGDLLLAYSDGLPDARSASGEPFGRGRIQALVSAVDPRHTTAQQLLTNVYNLVSNHRGEAEAFDDLTLLTLMVTSTNS